MPLTLRILNCSALAAATVGLAVIATPASAEMRVMESDVPEIKAGSVWPDDAQLPVPPGKHVRVLVTPANVTKLIEGPGTGNAAEAPWGATRQPAKAD